MWRSNCLESFLADMDGLDRCPAYRAAAAQGPGPTGRPPSLSLMCSESDEDAPADRRGMSRRRSRAPTAAAAGALLDHLDLAVVLMHPGGFVQLANAAARRISTRGDCFRIRARRLQLTDRQGQAALEEFLSAGATSDALPIGSRCLCRRSNGPVRYVVQAAWLDARRSDDLPTASLLIFEPYRVGRISTELLARLYGLTPMESQLAAALYSVPKLDAAATRCGISLNTAKTHLKHVFSKCDVGSKAELLRLLALGPRVR